MYPSFTRAAIVTVRYKIAPHGGLARGYNVSMNAAELILIVGEHAEIRSGLAEYLQRNGYRVNIAPDSDAMWAVIDCKDPDLVVLDVTMPGEDGLALCRKLHARSSVLVIMLGPDRYGGACIAGLEAGADDYVVKPVNPRELLARIKTVLRRSRASRQSDAKIPARAAIGS